LSRQDRTARGGGGTERRRHGATADCDGAGCDGTDRDEADRDEAAEEAGAIAKHADGAGVP